ncbi:biotin/lipoyl-binding protein [Caproiciproducens sp. NJN-50]|uniref:biotin/lipoyl-containing protein n=1 Tax=Acutalibacteraceae TaxID=3082771 RepID=UPI000FFE0B91|nr:MULTISPECIES: biotin/lipoyl-containing protein [Acutalibacteraceae]QAT49414.1 biotin/lipoyl-binding protein [Caproiciproducens sp. NJN-50]
MTKNLRITVNGTAYDVQVEDLGAASAPVQASPAPAVPATRAASPAPAAPAAKPAAPAGGETISSPMPGTIVSANVKPGQSVKKGDVLVVLEAMKMENEIMAPHDAQVAAVLVNKGDSVESGTPLVTLQ